MKKENLLFISDARELLRRVVTAEAKVNPLAAAFLGWLLHNEDLKMPLECAAEEASKARGADRTSRTVAILGFASGIKALKPRFSTDFSKQLEWLMGKPNSTTGGEPSGVVADPLTFAGVVVGAEAILLNESRIRFNEWGEGVWQDADTLLEGGSWRRGFLNIIGEQIKGIHIAHATKSIVQPAWLPAALQRCGWSVPVETSVSEVLKTSVVESAKVADAFEAGLRLEAIDWAEARVMDCDINAITTKDIAAVLTLLPEGFQRWTWEIKPRTGRRDGQPRRWHIENEYHVQSILYTVLKPIFQTLEEERYLAPTGTYQPRADLCLLSLQLLIEVKFWYRRDNAKHLIEEISADLTLYLRNESPYRQVIAVIWDDGARTEEHTELRRGLLGLNGLINVIIISRPAFMKETSESASVAKKKRIRAS